MASHVTGIILAAGLSSRMGAANKLTTTWQGKPMIVHVAEAALASKLDRVIVVTGHQADQVQRLLPEGVETVQNPDFSSGMASSLRAGVKAAKHADAVLVLLGDMPLVTSSHIDSIIGAFHSENKGSIVQASSAQQPGNPVLFASQFFPELLRLDGDAGAKRVIRDNSNLVKMVDIGDSAWRDFDVPEAFADQS